MSIMLIRAWVLYGNFLNRSKLRRFKLLTQDGILIISDLQSVIFISQNWLVVFIRNMIVVFSNNEPVCLYITKMLARKC